MTTPAPLPPGAVTAHRIRRLSLLVRGLVAVGALVLAVAVAALWIDPAYALAQIRRDSHLDDIAQLDAVSRLRCVAWMCVTAAVAMMMLLRLWQLFGEYAQGRIFGLRALDRLRGFARWTMAAAVLSPIDGAVVSVLATWNRAIGHRELNVYVSSEEYALLLFGAALLAISSVMTEAARLAEDNAGFV
ncbi:MAG TPA: DUF2975 domain-containing protein [Burkholderiaceae bacterium]